MTFLYPKLTSYKDFMLLVTLFRSVADVNKKKEKIVLKNDKKSACGHYLKNERLNKRKVVCLSVPS